MKSTFDTVSLQCSKLTTRAYSTSFSLGIYLLSDKLRAPIYSIYGFVRFADEIVDSFDGYNKRQLLQKFRSETYEAISSGISLNPILNSFQQVVNEYQIPRDLIDTFLYSMEMDLEKTVYNRSDFEKYILGSAEVVGLMCLHVFTGGANEKYQELKSYAMKLGSAFQKVNFLRDIRADYYGMGRSYFPGIDMANFSLQSKLQIEEEIEVEFRQSLEGIRKLPSQAKLGVYIAYVYYYSLFKKIKNTPAERIFAERIRISNAQKLMLMLNSMFQHKMNLV